MASCFLDKSEVLAMRNELQFIPRETACTRYKPDPQLIPGLDIWLLNDLASAVTLGFAAQNPFALWERGKSISTGAYAGLMCRYARAFLGIWINAACIAELPCGKVCISYPSAPFSSWQCFHSLSSSGLMKSIVLDLQMISDTSIVLNLEMIKEWFNCCDLATDFLLFVDIVPFIHKSFDPLARIIDSLNAGAEEQVSTLSDIQTDIDKFFSELCEFVFGASSEPYSEVEAYKQLKSIVDTRHRKSWSVVYEEDVERFEKALRDGERDLDGADFANLRMKMSCGEFIIFMLKKCKDDVFYRSHFCKFNFDKNNDYAIAQKIIKLLHESHLMRSVSEKTLNDTFSFFVNKIQSKKIKSVLVSYIYDEAVQKNARERIDRSGVWLKSGLEELRKLKEKAPTSAAQSDTKSLILQQCLRETLGDKLYSDNLNPPQIVLRSTEPPVCKVFIDEKYDVAIFKKYLTLWLAGAYSEIEDDELLEKMIQLSDRLSDKKNIEQIKTYVGQQVGCYPDLLIAQVNQFTDSYENFFFEKKRQFFTFIGMLSYGALQKFSPEKSKEYLIVKNDVEVRYAVAVLKQCSDYLHDGLWISAQSFMNEIKSSCKISVNNMTNPDFQEVIDKVMVLYWREKIQVGGAIDAEPIASIVRMLNQPSWVEDDLKTMEDNNRCLQSELALQKEMLSLHPTLFKHNDIVYIEAAVSRAQDVVIIIQFLKKLHNTDPSSTASIADFDSCVANLSVSEAQKQPYVYGLKRLQQDCERDVKAILDAAIIDHKASVRVRLRGHPLLRDSVEKLLNKKGVVSSFGFLYGKTSEWPAAKIRYIRSLIMNDDFNIANNIVLFFKQSNKCISPIKSSDVVGALSIVQHPSLKAYCTQLRNEYEAEIAYGAWIDDIESLTSKAALESIIGYMFCKPYAAYLSQKGGHYQAEWNHVMTKLDELRNAQNSEEYQNLLRTEYVFTWSISPRRSERAVHLLWQRLRCEAYITKPELKRLVPELKRLVPGFESMFTPANQASHNRMWAIVITIQGQPLWKFSNEFQGEQVEGNLEKKCRSLADGLKDRALKKTIDAFIATVFKDPHFCQTVTVRGTTPTSKASAASAVKASIKASMVLRFSHAFKRSLAGEPAAPFFTAGLGLGLIGLLIEGVSSSRVVPPAPSSQILQITHEPEASASSAPSSSSDEVVPEISYGRFPLEMIQQATPEEKLKIKVLRIHQQIMQATRDEGCAKQLVFFSKQVHIAGLPKTLQKLKNYIETHPLIECDEMNELEIHVIALQEIVHGRGTYNPRFNPCVRAVKTEEWYEKISGSLKNSKDPVLILDRQSPPEMTV